MIKVHYRTKAGSDVYVEGGKAIVDFDWLEEDACIECAPDPYPEGGNENDMFLHWSCEYCGGGSTKLERVFEDE